MKEVICSKAQDCYDLAQMLSKNLNGKINFEGCIYQEVLLGFYKCCSYDAYNTIDEYKKDMVPFWFKYSKGELLRLGVQNNTFKKLSTGHKLAVLSDFYEVLREKFGEPTLFYTTFDKEETLNFQWSFKNKAQDIQDFKNNTVFSDDHVNDLIIIGDNPNKQSDELNSHVYELPYDLINLIEENMEDFIEYKKGTPPIYSDKEKIDSLQPLVLNNHSSYIKRKYNKQNTTI